MKEIDFSFVIKLPIREFYQCKDLLAMIRKKSGRKDIHQKDIKEVQAFPDASCAIIIIERKKDSPIEIVTSIGHA